MLREVVGAALVLRNFPPDPDTSRRQHLKALISTRIVNRRIAIGIMGVATEDAFVDLLDVGEVGASHITTTFASAGRSRIMLGSIAGARARADDDRLGPGVVTRGRGVEERVQTSDRLADLHGGWVVVVVPLL